MKKLKPKIIAVVCVRMSSSRLPGKVMMEILGKPALWYLIERARKSKLIDEIVVATSSNADNDVIASFCQQSGISCFRGSEDDVLGRLLAALKAYRADVGVELFGDGPLIDPAIIDVMINFYLENENKYDFVSNDLKTTFPPGQEVEVYSTMALEDASGRAVSPDIREHGTLFIRQHPELYRLYNISAPPPLNYPEIEIELDTFEDFKVVQSIIENLYPAKPDFTIYDIIGFLQKYPALMETNKNIPRRWKQYRQDEV